MTRKQRLGALFSFLAVLVLLVAVLTSVGAVGPVELAVCLVLAIPLAGLLYTALVRRLGRRTVRR